MKKKKNFNEENFNEKKKTFKTKQTNKQTLNHNQNDDNDELM